MRRFIGIILATAAFSAIASPVSAAPPRVAVSADVSCLDEGGITIDLTFANTGRRVARIDPDFHVQIETVRRGRQPGVVLFVFPAPGFARIPPGESRTFLLTAGEPFEGVPATDFSGSRIIIEVEVWLRGRDHPVSRTLTYPACPALTG
jgi:hypothetical protein